MEATIEFHEIVENVSISFEEITDDVSIEITETIEIKEIVFEELGVPGVAGPQGPPGLKGDTGEKGEPGDTTAQGAKGDKGDTGDVGATGPQGIQGIKGDKGDKGDTGDVGATGTQGIQGIKGDKGDTGDVGATGTQGIQGIKGDSGNQGAQGVQGIQGIQGIQGEQGVTGNGFKIAKTYTTLAALLADTAPTGILSGEFAIVSTVDPSNVDNGKLYLWNGTIYSFTTDMSVQGVKGDTGAQGVQGLQGEQGIQGIQGLKGDTGNTGATGPQGSQGLKGDTGNTGATGPKGSQGAAGTNGTNGTNAVLPLVLTLASDFSSTSTTRADVTGMSFPVVAGKKYKMSLIGDYQTGVTTTGGSIGFVLTSGTGTIKGFITMSVLNTTQTASDLTATIRAINNVNTTAGSFMTSSAVSPINSPHYFTASLIFDCLTTGVFQLQYATEVASSASQMNAGSCMIIETLN